jgi:hypothetical protein
MSYFSVAPLEPGEAEQAYAMVRTLAPEVPPRLWSAFVAGCRERGELLALRGRVLLVDNFVTVELSRAAPGRQLLAAALERIAAEHGCGEIRQLFACGGPPDEDGPALRNHLALADLSTGMSFNKGSNCSCGNLHALSAAEMYPAP